MASDQNAIAQGSAASRVSNDVGPVGDLPGTIKKEELDRIKNGGPEFYKAIDNILLDLKRPVTEETLREKYAPKTTQVIPGADTPVTVVGDNKTSAPVKKITEFPLVENVLKQYPSYTYNLSLHVLSNDTFNEVMRADVDYKYVPEHVIVAGAGKYSSDFKRHREFKEDFYFDRLEIETVIGHNQQTRGTNAVDISFTLIEPNGVTFLNRFINAAIGLGYHNYMAVPCLIQIDFYGYDDNGIPISKSGKIEGHTKYIPVRLSKMDMDITTKGAVYQIGCVLYSHMAFSQYYCVTPAHMEVTAMTLSDFFFDSPDVDHDHSTYFASDVSDPMKQQRADAERLRKSREEAQRLSTPVEGETGYQQEKRIARVMENVEAARSARASLNGRLVPSFTGALNAWYRYVAQSTGMKEPDKISFIIHDKIKAAGKISFPDLTEPKHRAMGSPTNNNPQWSGSAFPISAGTSIIDVIDIAMRHSDYFTKQLVNLDNIDQGKVDVAALATKLDRPFEWYKVIPRVYLRGYDNKRNDHIKTIVYEIIPTTIYGVKHPAAPSTTVNSWHKQYNYLFTGKNDDVIDFNVKFTALYYSTLQGTQRITDLLNESEKKSKEDPTAPVQNKVDVPTNNVDILTKPVVMPVPKNTTVASTQKSAETDLGGAVIESILESTADLLYVTLKINGDPSFIKQDDVFYRPETTAKSAMTPNGSMRTDYNEIFCELNIKTPVDYDENGIADVSKPKEKYQTSVFSGIYKILTVKSTFTGGKFEQELTMARHPKQPTRGIDIERKERAAQGTESVDSVKREPRTGVSASQAQVRAVDNKIIQQEEKISKLDQDELAGFMQDPKAVVEWGQNKADAVQHSVGRSTKKIRDEFSTTSNPPPINLSDLPIP